MGRHPGVVRLLKPVVLLVLCGSLLTGCLVGGPPPAPPEEFQDFSVGMFGGVGGEQRVLRVRTDGVAVLASTRPASGRLSPADLDRVRELLTSEQFRRDVAAAAQVAPGSNRCSDLFVREVTMGSLTVRRSDRCGDEVRPNTPAFDEIMGLLDEELDGRFDRGVQSSDPPAVALELEQDPASGDAGSTTTVDATGTVTRRSQTAGVETRTLSGQDRDTLRLLADIAREVADDPSPQTCTSKESYRLTIATTPPVSGTNCTFRPRAPQFWAIVMLLRNQFA